MKYGDMLWVQNMARRCCGKPPKVQITVHTINHALHTFLDELCTLMMSYSEYFNELVRPENPEAEFRVFRIGNPRPGLMLLRGKDKLVISAEGTRIRARVVQVNAYNERSLDVMDFDAHVTPDNDLVWVCSENGQRVNPELVAKDYLGPFLVCGCQAFERDPHQTSKRQSSTSILEL